MFFREQKLVLLQKVFYVHEILCDLSQVKQIILKIVRVLSRFFGFWERIIVTKVSNDLINGNISRYGFGVILMNGILALFRQQRIIFGRLVLFLIMVRDKTLFQVDHFFYISIQNLDINLILIIDRIE